ncbi:MAG: PAS domain S-box protein, partial [Desulfobacteria bacterium]
MKQVKALGIGIVGGGPGCKAIIDMIFAKKLSQLRMKLIAVACTNPQAVGYRLAQEKGVFTTKDYRDLYELQGLDMIIELTGRDEVGNEISRTKPDNIQLMNHVAARLFWDVFQLEEDWIKERRSTEEALRESEERYRNVYETAPLAFVVWDRECRVMDWNQCSEETFGWSREEILGRNFFEFLVPESERPRVEDAVDNLLQGRVERDVVNENVTKTGETILCRWNNSILRDREGRIIGAISLGLNITDRKRAEDALRASEEKYSTLVENSLTGIYIDQDGKILFANKRFSEIYGYSEDEVPGIETWTLVHPEDRDLTDEIRAKRIKGEQVPSIYEARGLTKNGKTIWIMRRNTRIEYKGRPAILGNIADTTDRKQTEEALRESESKFRYLYDLSPQPIALTEVSTGRLIDVNDEFCKLTKYTREEVIGQTAAPLFYPQEDRDRFIRELQKSGEIHGLEMEFRANDGSIIIALMFSRLVRIADETLILTVFVDVTDRKRLEAKLVQAQKTEAIGTLAGGIAHDFNNLLMGIQGNISLMLMSMDPSYPDYGRLENIEKQIHSGARLTSRLLGYARKGKYEV